MSNQDKFDLIWLVNSVKTLAESAGMYRAAASIEKDQISKAGIEHSEKMCRYAIERRLKQIQGIVDDL